MKHIILPSLILSLFALNFAIAAPFGCKTDSYLFMSPAGSSSPTSGVSIDLVTGSSTDLNSSNSFHATNINAIGYNNKDGYIWGYDRPNDRVVRVGDNFIVDSYSIPGLPANAYHTGDVSLDGILFLAEQWVESGVIYKVDVDPSSANYLTYAGVVNLNPGAYSSLFSTESIADFALHPKDGNLYAIGFFNEKLYRINAGTGLVTDLGNIGIALGANPNAVWFDKDGYFYFNGNSTSIYRIDITDPTSPNPVAGIFSTLAVTSEGDAARCAQAGLVLDTFDYGDAPVTGTAADGSSTNNYGEARHTISSGTYMGAGDPDADSANQPAASADGDDADGTDDEDGVTFPALEQGQSATVTATVAGAGGYLQGWIDFDGNGTFNAVEQVASNIQDGGTGDTDGSTNGIITFNVSVPVSATTNQTYARFRWSTTNGLDATSSAGDGEVEDYSLTIAVPSCAVLSGDVSQVAAAIPVQIASGDKVFVASSSPVPGKQGHFKAYTIQSDGAVGATADWDADDEMSSTERLMQLYSTDTTGSKILFNLLDDVAFNRSGADPTVAKIKQYSFNPSVDAGAYLAGRALNSNLGTLSRGNDVALLENKVDTWSYLDDPAYRTFASVIRNRPQKALVTSDDGFVYAFKQSDGDLAWGWMPRQLVKELKDYNGFQGNGYMSGMLDTLEFKFSGSYGAYVIGSYKDGLGQYTLKLDTTDNDNLEAVVWDQDYSLVANGQFDEAPNHGERDYFKDGNGNTYTTYIVSKSNLSTLIIKKLGDNTAATEVALNFHVTSTPFVMPDFRNSQAPASKTLYLGAENGDIKRAALLNGTSLETAANIQTALQGTAVGTLADNDESITFLGAASAESGGGYYMRAQSQERLTVLKYNAGTTHWDHIWTSYVTGAGIWDSGNSYTADTSGVPTDNDNPGFFTNVTENGIQSIPAGARITDAAQIVAGAVVLPVSVPTTGSCSGKAYYYLYKLSSGVFPDTKFTLLDHTPITGDIALGYGDPKRVEMADKTSTNETIGFGHTDQNLSFLPGVTAAFLINDDIATGTRGWKERTQ